MKDLKPEFKACCLNKWDPHQINITDIGKVGKNYVILAENDKGPQIVEHNNTLAVQFTVERKYLETVKLLNNFITRMSEDIKVIFVYYEIRLSTELAQKLEIITNLVQ